MKFSLLLRYLTPHRPVLLAVLLLLLVSSSLALVQPWLAGQLTGALLGAPAAHWPLQQIMLAWLALLVARSLLGFGSQYCIGSTGEALAAGLRARLHEHLQALPLTYHQGHRRGDLLAILSNDAEIISGFVTNTLVQLLPLMLTFCGAIIMMSLIDPLIAGLALVLVPVYYLVVKIVGRSIRPIARAWVESYSSLFTFLDENLSMLPAIKAFNRESEESRRFAGHNSRLLSLSRRQLLVQSLLEPAVGLMAGLGLLLLLWFGSMRIATGGLAPEALVSLLLYALLLNQPMRGLANVYGQVQRARGAAERILDFLGEQPEPDDEGKPALPPVAGAIKFEKVDFHYPNGKPVLRGLDLDITAGETVAITGPNGVGKSTIAHLLMRMADPNAGRIVIDGIDIAGVSLASLRGQIGLVAQHTLLVNGTVSENIAYGRPWVDETAVELAARRAHAHKFISQLPDGYATLIGDQGLRLSGGQRQRISLARTLLVDPPILILDEATSMFDPAGEENFIAECREILRDKTVILITHRPASLALAQRIVRLQQHSEIKGRQLCSVPAIARSRP